MPSTCTICNTPLMGHPDADVTCGSCEVMNFAGDALRHPPRRAPHQSWWQGVERIIPPQHTDGLRALRFSQGRWSPENGIEESASGN